MPRIKQASKLGSDKLGSDKLGSDKLGSDIFCLVEIVKDIKFEFPWTSATDKTLAFK